MAVSIHVGKAADQAEMVKQRGEDHASAKEEGKGDAERAEHPVTDRGMN
jgi:hypothetical protein